MLYLNVNDYKVMSLLSNVNQKDVQAIRKVLMDAGVEFASIKKTENGGLEIIHDSDYVLLGPLGGITKTEGKWDKYNCFERDIDEVENILKAEVDLITNGSIPVINLGEL